MYTYKKNDFFDIFMKNWWWSLHAVNIGAKMLNRIRFHVLRQTAICYFRLSQALITDKQNIYHVLSRQLTLSEINLFKKLTYFFRFYYGSNINVVLRQNVEEPSGCGVTQH